MLTNCTLVFALSVAGLTRLAAAVGVGTAGTSENLFHKAARIGTEIDGWAAAAISSAQETDRRGGNSE